MPLALAEGNNAECYIRETGADWEWFFVINPQSKNFPPPVDFLLWSLAQLLKLNTFAATN